jgi:uncharacterized membrane protein SpoIIM required for sporulation
MDSLQFNCSKSTLKLIIWIIFALMVLGALKGATASYLRQKDSFDLILAILSAIGCAVTGYMLRSYFMYRSVTLHVSAVGTLFSMANKDDRGRVIKEKQVELMKIYRAWIIKKRSGYKIALVLDTDKSSEIHIDTVPTQLYDIKEQEATAILSFIRQHNPLVKIGYM